MQFIFSRPGQLVGYARVVASITMLSELWPATRILMRFRWVTRVVTDSNISAQIDANTSWAMYFGRWQSLTMFTEWFRSYIPFSDRDRKGGPLHRLQCFEVTLNPL